MPIFYDRHIIVFPFAKAALHLRRTSTLTAIANPTRSALCGLVNQCVRCPIVTARSAAW